VDIQFLKECFKNNLDAQAIIWRDCVYDYSWLLKRLTYWDKKIEDWGILSGHVVAMDADYSPETVVLFLSLMERSAIIVPITTSTKESIRDQVLTISKAEFIIQINQQDDVVFQRTSVIADQLLYKQLRKDQKAGLVLFSSGSSGTPKAVVHDLTLIECQENCPNSGATYKLDSIKIEEFKPQEVKIKVTDTSGRWLVYSDANLPIWEAYIDNQKTPIYTANFLFKAVFVPKGEHEVIFKYPNLWGQFKYAFKSVILGRQ